MNDEHPRNGHDLINIRGKIEAIQATLSERETLEKERFDAQEKAWQAAIESKEREKNKDFIEFQRRLDELSGEHKLAVLKESDFVRQAAATQQFKRIGEDVVQVGDEAKLAASKVAETLTEQDKRTGARFEAIESFQNKLFGGLILASLAVPTLTGIITYLATRPS